MKFVVDVEEYKEPDPPPKPSLFGTILKITLGLTLALSLTLSFTQDLNVADLLFKSKQVPNCDFVYDTNAKYSQYIRGSLSENQLQRLDKLLELEKKLCGLPLERKDVLNMSSGDQVVIAAYNRWREIYNYRRSHGNVIYPSERDNFTN